jgi:inosose dehydratase
MLDRDVAMELQAVADHARLLHSLGAEVMVYGECGRMLPDRPLDAGLSRQLTLGRQEWDGYAARITEFAARLQERHGLRLAYHHHLMMVAETFDELSTLFDRTGPEAGLLLDLGHATAAGFDYNRVIERFGDRIVHIHLKDVRTEVLAQVRTRDLSFNEGVRRGLFAVPGQGQVDYAGIIRHVHDTGYSGWLVVEAEQDPARAQPGHGIKEQPMSKRPLNIGLIGSGFMGQAHADAYRRAAMLYPGLPLEPRLYKLADVNAEVAAMERSLDSRSWERVTD